jgi:hydroxymethylpyrimidine pyrophosphatase-like HAD family hydrolase
MIAKSTKERLIIPQTAEEALELNLSIDYQAYAFDIDGTIKDENGLDVEVLDLIRQANSQERWVLFLTNGVKQDHEDLIRALSGFPHLDLIRVHFENGDSVGEFQDGEFIVSSEAASLNSQEIESVTNAVESALKSRTLSLCLRVSELENAVRSAGFKVVNCGNGDLTFSKSDATKGKTLARFCEEEGLDIYSVFKIGDQPQEGGNDHDFLQTPGSFSCSEEVVEEIFPVIFPPKKGTNKGPNTTKCILETILTICE